MRFVGRKMKIHHLKYKYMDDCIFCKIVKNEIPSSKIYEDDKVLVFLDIAPNNFGHSLVITKQHIKNLEEITEDELCYLMKVVKKIGKAVKNGLEVEGYNIISNNDPVAGQMVPHIHFHIIPRIKDDGFKFWPHKEYNSKEEMSKIAEQIKKEL